MNHNAIELSIIIPCLNEAETIEACIEEAKKAVTDHQLSAEILVIDNDSTDHSAVLAQNCGAKVIHVKNQGYGAAIHHGILEAQGKYILMGDGDGSYSFTEMERFLTPLRSGADLVMGCRLPRGGGKIEPGAMPFLHRWVGNPVLSFVGRLFFKISIDDFHCGLRAFRREAILNLHLVTTGMEFASEMIVKASFNNLKIEQIPITLHPDKRSGKPHLRTWRDGWRHLRFMLLFSPKWLFLLPGIVLTLSGLILGLWLLPGPQTLGSITFDIHTLFFSASFIFVGLQAIFFFGFTKVFATQEKLIPPNKTTDSILRFFSLEKGVLVGLLFCLIGGLGALNALLTWKSQSFGPLDPSEVFRIIIPAILSILIGFQTILASFFLSILKLERKNHEMA